MLWQAMLSFKKATEKGKVFQCDACANKDIVSRKR